MQETKYIFITGGVVSSLGKGIAASSIGMLLEKMGLKVAMMKLDPYLNVDPGTMSPFQHGEVFVTDDGAETDLDLGHYHRFTHSPLSRSSSITSGQIYNSVIRRERRGDYLGKTVQVIPHVTDEIKHRISECAQQEPGIDIVICEIGGTVGDIESLPFLEAIRQLRYEKKKNALNIHVTYVPYIKAAGELKTKPTQHSVQILREIGISADCIVCRAEQPLPDDVKEKISLFCNVDEDAVFVAPDVETSIYEAPLHLLEQGVTDYICKQFGLERKKPDVSKWQKLIETIKHPKKTLVCGIVGKYVQHQDAYKSVLEALRHASIHHGYAIEFSFIESDSFDEKDGIESWEKNQKRVCDGYLVPGGFGDRGWEGKIICSEFCRTKKVPYFGICLGMQVLVVEFCRNVLGLKDADSTEMRPTTVNPVISLLEEQRMVSDRGGTMRLGAYPCNLKKGSKAYNAYKADTVSERHRHRYEFNNKYKESLEKMGLLFSGTYDKANLCEIVEVVDHPWMVGVQFHPEFLSKPTEPHPLFVDFVQALIKHHKEL